MPEASTSRGYLLAHQDWYELPHETDPLLRNAKVTSLNPQAFVPPGAHIVKHAFQILEVADETPAEFTICECRRVGEPHYDTFDEARDVLRNLGVAAPRVGFNPIARKR